MSRPVTDSEVIDLLGGPAGVAEKAGVSRQVAYRWAKQGRIGLESRELVWRALAREFPLVAMTRAAFLARGMKE